LVAQTLNVHCLLALCNTLDTEETFVICDGPQSTLGYRYVGIVDGAVVFVYDFSFHSHLGETTVSQQCQQ